MSKIGPSATALIAISEATRQLDDIRERIAGFPQEYRELFAGILRVTAETLAPSLPVRAPVPQPETIAEDDDGAAADDSTVAERMEEFLRNRRNRPATIAEICEGTNISINVVRVYLQKRNKGRFVKVPTKLGRPGLWRSIQLAPSPRSNEEKRSAVIEALETTGADELSNGVIAELAGVSDQFVANMRRELGRVVPPDAQVVGRDGETHRRPGKNTP